MTLGGVRYFCTGDVGELVGPGQVRVIDRCKSHFKLSQGVYVSPEAIEAVLSRSAMVDQLFIWGSGYMSAVAAVVVPTAELLVSPGLRLHDGYTTVTRRLQKEVTRR